MIEQRRQDINLTSLARCGGCGAKLPVSELSKLLASLNSPLENGPSSSASIMLGISDDALVYSIPQPSDLIATVDFFPPIVDDAFAYGAISAANSMSDVFATGGEVLFVLNIVGTSKEIPLETLQEILAGAKSKVTEAGGVIGGGHSIVISEPVFGMCVIGTPAFGDAWRTRGAKPGDVVFLTKPLGVGMILTAARNDAVSTQVYEEAVGSMMKLNVAAMRGIGELQPSAVTDVTGFGLIGHSLDIAAQSGVCLELQVDRVPTLSGARHLAEQGIRTSAHASNLTHYQNDWELCSGVNDVDIAIGLDPQTSGGLLFTISKDKAVAVIEAGQEEGFDCWEVGTVLEGEGLRLIHSDRRG